MTEEKPPFTRDEYALLVDAVQDYAIFVLGPSGEIRSWNRGAARIMGYRADEVLGSSFSRFYPDETRDLKPKRELEVALAEGRVEDEGWRIRKNGERFWANTVITALRDEGKLIGFAKVTRDLTERRQNDEKLRHSEEIFRLLVDSVFDYAIFMLDEHGNIASWNAGARRIKGYEAEEIIGRHFSTFYPEEDKRAGKPEWELEVARERGSVEDEGWRVRKDGSCFWANVLITAVYDETGTLRGFAKVTRDVTERKQAEEVRLALVAQREARLQAEEERRRAETSYLAAQEANRAKDEFLMTLSHELRTPLTAILGWARLLPTLPPDDPVFAEAVAAIGRSAQLQSRLIEDVLDVSRIVAGKLRLTRDRVEVDRLLAAAIDAVRATADARSIALRTSFAEGLGAMVADPTRLHQVIWNLLTNAVKFTPPGGSVEVLARRAGGRVEISVKDSGEGIDPQFLAHVFEPFRQAESPGTRVHGGLGLGLSIVRYLVQAHGGSVTAASEGRGHGATFTVTLPVASARLQPGDPAEEAAVRRQDIHPARLANVRLLVVDDDRETREYVSAVLRRAGADVSAVQSAQAGLDHLDGARPHLIVTDVAMPEMDGHQFAEAVRTRHGPEMKIVALTAFPPGVGKVDPNAFDAYLTKPIEPVALVDAVASAVGADAAEA